MRGLETENEVNGLYTKSVYGKNLSLEDIKESTLTVEYPMTKKHFARSSAASVINWRL